MSKQVGIPYMGGKGKIASKIVDKILSENPNVKYVYDLFGGGGAMSFEFMKRPQIKKVFYNEIDTAVVSLMNHVTRNGTKDPFFLQWISRDDFMKLKDGTDWKSGYARTCWSFGNNLVRYMFGRNIEELKRLLFEVVVYKSNECLENLSKLGYDVPKEVFELDTVSERRKFACRALKNAGKRTDLESLERLESLESLERLQSLERLESLERLQSLERLESLEISNMSYDEVEISTPIDETIIYLDPPYRGTNGYKNAIDYEKFDSFVKNCPYKVYVSEYDIPYLESVLEIPKKSSYSSSSNNTETIEKLFVNS